MTDPAERSSPFATLYQPGERFGWTFRDRNLFRARYTQPYPPPTPIPPSLVEGANRAQQKMVGRMFAVGGAFLAFTLLFGCCGGLAYGEGGGASIIMFGLAAFAFALALGGAGAVWAHTRSTTSALDRTQRQQAADHAAAVTAWQLARDQHEQLERARVDGLDEWGAVTPPPGPRRVDIVGGNLWGWEAFLTVFGGSLLRTRGPVTLVDFTGEMVCGELVRLAADNGVSHRVSMLPAQLGSAGLLDGLSSRQIVDVMIESMHGENATGARAERAQDDRILMTICSGLGERPTLSRIGAALRLLAGEPGDHSALTPDERRKISGELFANDFRREARGSLRRIEAFVHPLEDLGAAVSVASGPVTLDCLVDESDTGGARRELLKDLIVQALIQRIAGDRPTARSVVIAGADEIGHVHLERLADLCERRDVRLVLMFRHLRGTAVKALGGGVVGFMRLPNHEEARHAADFIGREHKFVLSRLARTVGGNETHSTAGADGFASQRGGGWSASGRHTSSSTSRSWTRTVTEAQGSNWSEAESHQRVYEYVIEPRALQDLPDYALLVVKGQGAGATLQAVECNPEIVTLPRMSMDPLPELELPAGGLPAGELRGGELRGGGELPTQTGVNPRRANG